MVPHRWDQATEKYVISITYFLVRYAFSGFQFNEWMFDDDNTNKTAANDPNLALCASDLKLG